MALYHDAADSEREGDGAGVYGGVHQPCCSTVTNPQLAERRWELDLEYAALTALHRDGYITLCTSQSREDCGAQKASGVRSLPHA